MFEPGHFHMQIMPGLDQQEVDVHIRYEVRQDAARGVYVHFNMQGEIDHKAFAEEWDMPKEQAFNFASDASRIAQKHGMHPQFGAVVLNHSEYDAMFEDIRHKLGVHSGEPINLNAVLGS